MSSTVNIITKTIKNITSIPIQSLTSRLDNYDDENGNTKDGGNKLQKTNPIDIIFVLEDKFKDLKAPENKKYAVIKPIEVGISGENYYSVNSGVKVGDTIVTGGYRLISKDLNHGDLVSLKNDI